jgi:molecular chaperone DnaK (HSP70)
MPAQSELPRQASSGDFCTSRDNQQEIVGEALEGDLPLADLNTRLAEVRLKLPPNVPAQDRVVVHFTVDENSTLTAELEVPSVNRRGSVVVNLKSPATQVHLFQQVDNVLNDVGARIRPEERAALQQGRLAIEDLAPQFRRAREEGTDADTQWKAYTCLREEAQKLRARIEEARKKYGNTPQG